MAILTKKFSEFLDGGDLENSNTTVGLKTADNAKFNNPWTFLAPGNTAARPPVTASMFDRLRFNTELSAYEYYDSMLAMWVQLSNSGTIDGPFVIYTADAGLPSAFNLGALATGLLKQSVTLGEATPAIAQLDTDYYGPDMSGYMQAPAGIKDNAGNIIFSCISNIAAVNYLTFANRSTGLAPEISVDGADPDIQLNLKSKGEGALALITEAANNAFIVNSGTSSLHETVFSFYDTVNNVNIRFQDASGTVAFLTDIPTSDNWVDQTTASVTMAVNTGYTSDAGATLVTFTLPPTSAIGDWVEINGKGSGLWIIAQAAGQEIFASPTNTTLGVGGSLASVNAKDCVRLRCITANTLWDVVSQQSAGLTIV